MTLAEYLKEAGLTDAAFGAKCKPRIHRTEVWSIKNGKRTPGAVKVDAIERASGYRVRAPDLIGTKKKSKNGHGSPRKVVNS